MTVKELRGLFTNKKEDSKKGGRESSSNRNQAKDKVTLLSMFDNLRITHQFTMRTSRDEDQSLLFEPSVHSIAIRGEIPLTPKWRLTIGNLDYNFIRKSTSYPDLSLSRDLHCWTMGIGWQPERSTYNFYIRVKPSSLGFIRVPYTRNRADGFGN